MSLGISLLCLAVILILIGGFYSLFVTKNLIRTLISIEILMKAVTLLLVIAGYVTKQLQNVQAYIITMIVIEVVVLSVAAGIVINIYRKNESLDTKNINSPKE